MLMMKWPPIFDVLALNIQRKLEADHQFLTLLRGVERE
jgi:hypothetical protein